MLACAVMSLVTGCLCMLLRAYTTGWLCCTGGPPSAVHRGFARCEGSSWVIHGKGSKKSHCRCMDKTGDCLATGPCTASSTVVSRPVSFVLLIGLLPAPLEGPVQRDSRSRSLAAHFIKTC
eukprot:1162020-Pelagomonas_calceolata.AAC.5